MLFGGGSGTFGVGYLIDAGVELLALRNGFGGRARCEEQDGGKEKEKKLFHRIGR